jgi:UDP-N-acetylglucosamine--N-acetylmuramyl-(pentapeptide) pyrophosphoryl-undecaprenol N-acetylglucosamine transferase
MKVLIVPCGIGMGHTSRCVTIARKLQEKGVEVAFASYGSGYETLKEHYDYKLFKLPDIKFYGVECELDIKYTAKKSIHVPFVFLKSIYKEFRMIKNFKPDIILADSHFSIPITAKLLGITCIMIQNELTLNFSELYPEEKSMEYLETGLKKFVEDVCNLSKVIMIPDIPLSTEIPAKLKNKVVHTGPLLRNDPSEMINKKDLRYEMGFKESDKIVLVTVGGSKFGIKLLKLICEASAHVNADKLIIVSGPQINDNFIQKSNKIIKKKFLDNMMEWMKISDVIVTLAGHTTTMEIMTLGIPNLTIPIENHPEQLKNSLNIEKYGITIVEEISNLDSKKITEDINRLLEDPDLKERAEIVKDNFLIYNGTENAVKIINDQYNLDKIE